MKTLKVQFIAIVSSLFLAATPFAASSGDTRVDSQLRIPLHVQTFPFAAETNSWMSGFGWAAWDVFSDLTVKDDDLKSLFISGPAYQYEPDSWVELLGGALVNEGPYYVDPFINLRFSEKTIPHFILGGDTGCLPGKRSTKGVHIVHGQNADSDWEVHFSAWCRIRKRLQLCVG